MGKIRDKIGVFELYINNKWMNEFDNNEPPEDEEEYEYMIDFFDRARESGRVPDWVFEQAKKTGEDPLDVFWEEYLPEERDKIKTKIFPRVHLLDTLYNLDRDLFIESLEKISGEMWFDEDEEISFVLNLPDSDYSIEIITSLIPTYDIVEDDYDSVFMKLLKGDEYVDIFELPEEDKQKLEQGFEKALAKINKDFYGRLKEKHSDIYG